MHQRAAATMSMRELDRLKLLRSDLYSVALGKTIA
jgi:hypothetical protein